jgi:hypothetical protein
MLYGLSGEGNTGRPRRAAARPFDAQELGTGLGQTYPRPRVRWSSPPTNPCSAASGVETPAPPSLRLREQRGERRSAGHGSATARLVYAKGRKHLRRDLSASCGSRSWTLRRATGSRLGIAGNQYTRALPRNRPPMRGFFWDRPAWGLTSSPRGFRSSCSRDDGVRRLPERPTTPRPNGVGAPTCSVGWVRAVSSTGRAGSPYVAPPRCRGPAARGNAAPSLPRPSRRRSLYPRGRCVFLPRRCAVRRRPFSAPSHTFHGEPGPRD